MGKYFKLLVLTMSILCMVAGSAFAGTARVNHAAAAKPIIIATETLGAARNVYIQASAAITRAAANTIAPISFEMGQALASANLLQVTFSGGAAFTGDQITICGSNSAAAVGIVIGTATPTSGSTNQVFQISDAITNSAVNAEVGYSVWLQRGSDACAVTANAVMPVQILSTATAPAVALSYMSSGGIAIDTAPSVTVATILREFTATNASTTHTIDYLASGASGNKILNGSNATSQLIADSQAATAGVNIVAFVRNAQFNTGVTGATAWNAYASNLVAGNYGAGLNIRGQIIVTDPDQSWSGINRVFLTMAPADCSQAGNIVGAATNSPAGSVTFNVPAGAGAGNWPDAVGVNSMGYNLCVNGSGATLSTRTLKAQANILVTGTGAGAGISGEAAAAQVWGINGYQAQIPWVVTDDTLTTYCLVNNGNATGDPASVLFEAVASESGVSISSISLGTVAARTSKLLILDGSNATLAGGTPVSLVALGATKRYKVKTTITAPPANVSIACVQKDAGGTVKRAVPVLTSETAGAFKN